MRLRRQCLERDGWRCRDCGKAGKLEAHHVKPLEAGGADELDNLRALCRDCHIETHRRPEPPEVRAWRLLRRSPLPEASP